MANALVGRFRRSGKKRNILKLQQKIKETILKSSATNFFKVYRDKVAP